MLDFTGRPAASPPAMMPAPKGTPSSAKFLSDLHTHVRGRTDVSPTVKTRYLGAIGKAGEVLNTPLSRIEANLALTEEQFQLDGYDPVHWPTNNAYLQFRRRLQAPLREFLGIHAEQAQLRAMEDDWTVLFEVIEPLTEGRVGHGAAWHPMKLAALKAFALVARAYGWQPRDLTLACAEQIEADFQGNKRATNRRSLQNLDELRAFPQTLPLLPAQPIGFSPAHRVPQYQPLNRLWEAQFSAWIETMTKSGWDPVARTFTDKHDGHARVLRSACRTLLRIGLDTGALSADEKYLRAFLADDEALCTVASDMFARRTRKQKDGRLAPRTSRKYLKGINQIRAHLGLDTTMIGQVIANNIVAREGRTADKRMTPENRKFCETLVEKRMMRRRFLLSYRPLREAAEAIIAHAAREKRKLTGQERARVRMLGASACFAALEIGGAPIRVTNAMGLTCTGEDAQIRIPEKAKKPIKVLLSASMTKNKREIEFPIRANGFGYFDTVRWYYQRIRPLFPHAASSPYLFPAVTTPGAQLNSDFFGAEFAGLMRTVVDLPMTPHQMRHGQTSLLLNKYPNEIEVIAKRIDDTPETLRKYYGWLNALTLVERGQDLLIGLIDD